ncbi:MAG: glycosyltransferase family 39 protein [Flavobacteriales bacterium]|nr:glycosyltransferase family 39 protein [Flavobacteriales bacterium]
MDEPFTIFHSQQSLSELMELFRNENNPPLFFLIMHFWIGLFGIEAEAIRVVPVVISALTAPVILVVVRRHFDEFTAWSVAIMFLLSDLHQYQAHDARAYPLFILLTVWSLHHFLSLVEKPSKLHVIGLGVSGALLIYNHFLGSVVLMSYAIVTLASKQLRVRILLYMIGAGAVVVLAFLPYAPILFHRLSVTAENGGTWVPKPGFEGLYNLLWAFCNQPVVVVSVLTVMAFGIIFSFKNRQFPSTKEGVIYALFLIPYLGLFVSSQWFPVYMSRYLSFISIAFFLTVIRLSLKIIPNKWMVVPAFLLVIGFVASFQPKQGHQTDERVMIEHLMSVRNPNEAILVNPEWTKLSFAYHFSRSIFKDHTHLNERLNRENIFPVYSIKDLPEGFKDKFSVAYQITPVNNNSDWIQNFKSDIQVNYPNVRTDTAISENMLLVYRK